MNKILRWLLSMNADFWGAAALLSFLAYQYFTR